jgi:outer membrane immunogenic protein
MRTQLLLLATVSSLVASTPAFAKDEARFTGARVEVNSGFDSTRYDDGVAATPNTLDGIRIGGAVGYDLAVGKAMAVGVEAGGGYSISGNVSGQAGTTSYRLTGGYDLDASIRVGARVAPSTLLFVKGGYARSEFRLRTTVGGATGSTVSTAEDGWRVGTGVEQAFGDRFYAKAEYRYTDYGNDVSRHQAIVGLGYRF